MVQRATPIAVPSPPDATAIEHLETELAVLARRLEQAARRSDTDRRLDRAGYLLARTIETLGPVGVNELAQALGLDGSTVTRQVGALGVRGFVSRRPDPTDGRAVLLSLTAAGRREVEKVRDRRLERLSSALGEWPDADLGALADLLGRFNRDLGPAEPVTERP